jgi:hypothetical protein
MRRLAFYHTRFAIDDRQLALEQGHQHPDYENVTIS